MHTVWPTNLKFSKSMIRLFLGTGIATVVISVFRLVEGKKCSNKVGFLYHTIHSLNKGCTEDLLECFETTSSSI